MGKPPTKSRKDVRASAPYRRERDTTPPPAHPERSEELGDERSRRTPAPLGKIQLVQAPAPAPAPPASPPPPPMIASLPAPTPPTPPTPAGPAQPERSEAHPVILTVSPSQGRAGFAQDARAIAAFQTSLGFATAALVALPHPADLVAGDPSAPEPPPGAAPAGDARSLRAGDQFALIYRHGAAVVSQRGKLGERGTWRVVDYPSPTLAAHAYALECSRLAGQGFRDVS